MHAVRDTYLGSIGVKFALGSVQGSVGMRMLSSECPHGIAEDVSKKGEQDSAVLHTLEPSFAKD